MSMGAVLKQVRDHLRSAMSLGADQCGIQPTGTPPRSAGDLYVAVSEQQVRSTARSHLREVYDVEVSVWRRPGQYPADRLGEVTLRDDPYLAGVLTLDDLERGVIQALHANYTDITAAANAAVGAGSAGAGDVFQTALYYTGRERAHTLPGGKAGQDTAEWIGRRLQFTGMTRVQAVDVMR